MNGKNIFVPFITLKMYLTTTTSATEKCEKGSICDILSINTFQNSPANMKSHISEWPCTSRARGMELNRNTNVQYSSIQVHRPSWLEHPIAEKRAWEHSLMLLGLSHVPRLWVTVNCYWLWSQRAGVSALLNTNPVLGLLLVSLSRSLSLSV